MGIISWIILGLIASFVAKLIMPGDDPGGIVVTIIIGIAGGVIGGFVGNLLYQRSQFMPHWGFPARSGPCFFVVVSWTIKETMALAIALREDDDAGKLGNHAKRSRDPRQVR